MKKLLQSKNKATWLLLTGILVLCAGFIISGCGIGTGPQIKVQDPNKGQYALDYTSCQGNNDCSSAFESHDDLAAEHQLTGKELTLEAWIKPKATSTGTMLQRGGTSAGAKLTYTGDTPTTVLPKFTILRTVISPASPTGTSTVSYAVEGTAISINTWTHIAGILTSQDHSGAGGHPACADVAPYGGGVGGIPADPNPGGLGGSGSALNDPWHIDIYQGGTLTACAVTYGDTDTGFGDADPTYVAEASADEPVSHGAVPGVFQGIIDEARIWNTNRVVSGGLSECMSRELDTSGICNWDVDDLILYVRFNEGEGHSLADFTGVFSTGGLEYPDPAGGGNFLEWTNGWTTDTPF